MGADRPRSGQVGASIGGHDLSASRDHSLSLLGRVRSARASPGVALMFCTVSTKCRRFARPLSGSFGSRTFNPLRWRPPTGRTLARPGPHGRFQPMPVALADPSPPGFRPDVSGNLPRTVAKGCHRRPPTNASRSTTPESRIGRRTCALPVPSGGIIMRRADSPRMGNVRF
jgi:hypothetical protein